MLRCNIQWMDSWDDQGMQAVAAAHLQPVIGESDKASSDTGKLVQQAVALHNSRLPAGATPSQYVAFVSLTASLYAQKRSHLLQQQHFLKVWSCYFSTAAYLSCFLSSRNSNSHYTVHQDDRFVVSVLSYQAGLFYCGKRRLNSSSDV